jgi:carbonic anhydrase
MSLIEPTARRVDETHHASDADYLSQLERASIVRTMDNLKTFPEIRTRVDAGHLHLIGAYFDVGTGDLTIYDPSLGAFAPIDAGTAQQASAPVK